MSCRERRLLDCKPKKPCGDTIKLSTEAIAAAEDLECLKTKKGDKLTKILREISEYLCRLKESIESQGTFIIENIGTGAKLFKGVSIAGKRQFKTMVSEDSTELEITEEENEIVFKVNIPEAKEKLIVTDETEGEGKSLFQIDNEDEKGIRGLISETIGITEEGGNLRIEKEDIEIEDETCTEGTSLFSTNTTTTKGFRGLKSNSIDIYVDGECIQLEVVEDIGGVPRYIVNNSYTGTEELGTESKPFKNIKNALTEFVGAGGTNENPQNPGAYIIVQRGISPYTHSEGLTYKNLNLVQEEGSEVRYTQTGFLVDFDSLYLVGQDEKSSFTYRLSKGSKASIVNGSGFRNRGSDKGSAQAKTIGISGEGEIDLQGNVYSGNRVLYSCNILHTEGYSQPAMTQVSVTGILSRSAHNRIVEIGNKGSITFRGGTISSGGVGLTLSEPNIEAINVSGGSFTLNETVLKAQGIYRDNFITMSAEEGLQIETNVRVFGCLSEYPGNVDKFFKKIKEGQPKLEVVNFTSQGAGINIVFNATDTNEDWISVNSYYGQYTANNLVSDDRVDLTRGNTQGVINSLNKHLIESLPELTQAQADLLPKGTKFINIDDSRIDIVMV